MPKQKIKQKRAWYAIHTYVGYEEIVAENLKRRIENLDMGDKIFNVLVPKEKKIKVRNGKRKVVEEKILPGYVLVDMIITDDSWYVVRNTPKVTGFIGAGTVPLPLSEKEIERIKTKMEIKEPEYKIDVKIGSNVKITDGPFKDFTGKITEIDKEKGKVKVMVDMFGRDTPVEVDSLQIKKL